MEPVVKKCGSQNFDSEKILISAALLHDVFDHKYSSQKEAENGMTEIRNFLKNENFHEKEIDAVIKICENTIIGDYQNDEIISPNYEENATFTIKILLN